MVIFHICLYTEKFSVAPIGSSLNGEYMGNMIPLDPNRSPLTTNHWIPEGRNMVIYGYGINICFYMVVFVILLYM